MERAIIALEELPWSVLYRASIGFCIVPVYPFVAGNDYALWKMGVVFLGVLIALRIGPGVLRRALPFSREAKAIWAQRRDWAKRYDSYQWQKLLGLGMGWLAGVAVFDAPSAAAAPGLFCAVIGAIGMLLWTRHKRSIPQPQPATAVA